MKNKFYLILLMLTSLSLVGHADQQLRMLKDSKMYYEYWNWYDSCEPNGSFADSTHAKCYRDGKFVDTIYPLTEEQVYYAKRKKEQEKEQEREQEKEQEREQEKEQEREQIKREVKRQMNDNYRSIDSDLNEIKNCKKFGDLSNRVYNFTGYCPIGYY